jgi:hypothetical protein
LCIEIGFTNEETVMPIINEINKIQKQTNNLILKIKKDNK